jgi:subtilisin family serine protease
VASRLVEQGVLVTIAAGNSGYEGPFYPSNGAAGEYVLAVSSTVAVTSVSPAFYGTFNLDGESNTTEVAYIPAWDVAFPKNMTGILIIPLSMDTSIEDFACTPLPEDTPDLSDFIPLVRRASACVFGDQQVNLEAFGAKYILFYNDDQPLEPPWSISEDKSVRGMVDKRAGEAIIGTYAAGGNVTGDFSLDPDMHFYGMYNSAGGTASLFTSWGALHDLTLKPDIAAPGENIFSTWPNCIYSVLSGTSMATPYIAGIAALYIGEFGGRGIHGAGFAKDLAIRIMSSGRSIPWRDGETQKDYGFWAPPIQVGIGLVDAYKVWGI